MSDREDRLSLTIPLPPLEYAVTFGDHLLECACAHIRSCACTPFLITTTALVQALPHVPGCAPLVLPEGEGIKSREMKAHVEDQLIERGCGRQGALLAVGGGTLLDLVGFTAATYCRGIPYVSMPSTVLAMTDAAIGGKTGINVAQAKNWIGAFHQPSGVFIDFSLLSTLPQQEFVSGFAETIKHGLIADRTLFDFLEAHRGRLLERDLPTVRHVVRWSCALKKSIVERDPYETRGLRRILNFGHTIGHALESLSGYACSHGQAVLMGMQVEAAIAHRLRVLSSASFERILTFLRTWPIPLPWPDHPPCGGMALDKKGAYRFVLLTDIGSVASCGGEYVTSVAREQIEAGWGDVVRAYQGGLFSGC